MGYGIGRVPRDVDGTTEALAEIEAAELMARATTGQRKPRDPNDYRECRECGATGYVGSHPFSTVYSPSRRCVCDDCA
jgi:hypothetical protein